MKAILRYLGAKNRLADWIVEHFPPHKTYVEPFGGTAAVLLNKAPAELDVYNDKFGRIVNFFRVVRENGEELARQLELTPYAQDEYAASFEGTDDPVEDARRFAVHSMMSYGGGVHKPGFKRNGLLRMTPYPKTWREYPEVVRECAAELRRRNVEINKIDALEIMARYDSGDTLHYVDPPYVHMTRFPRVRYTHEYDDADHEKLLSFLQQLKGKVILSGYDSGLYADHLAGWRKECKVSHDTQGNRKTECLWLNFKPQNVLL